MYQYPARLAMNATKHKTQSFLQVDLIWHDKRETEIEANITAEELVEKLNQKYGFEKEYGSQCYIKTIGENGIGSVAKSILLQCLLLDHCLYVKLSSAPTAVPT